jgi:hypothetical protein
MPSGDQQPDQARLPSFPSCSAVRLPAGPFRADGSYYLDNRTGVLGKMNRESSDVDLRMRSFLLSQRFTGVWEIKIDKLLLGSKCRLVSQRGCPGDDESNTKLGPVRLRLHSCSPSQESGLMQTETRQHWVWFLAVRQRQTFRLLKGSMDDGVTPWLSVSILAISEYVGTRMSTRDKEAKYLSITWY